MTSHRHRRHSPSSPSSCSPRLLSLYLLCFVICCPVLCLAASSHFASSLTFQIEPRLDQCFYEELQQGDTFTMEFEVVRGGLLDIRLRVSDPSGALLIEKMAFFNRNDDGMNEAEGRVNFAVQSSGRYSICFDNSMSRWTAKVVSFFIPHTAASASAAASASLAASATKLQDLGPMVDSIIKIADTLDSVEQLQHRERVKEQAWRDEGDAADDAVQWLSLIESVLLIGLTTAQLYYIRNWFKETGKIGRV